MLDDLQTPEAILADTWQRLTAAAADRLAAFHTPSVAIADEIKGVTSRIVILRRVEPAQRALSFHTDRRSAKVAGLQQDPTTAWLFWDPAERLQLRIHTTATLHTTDAVAHEQWNAASEQTRGMYRTPLAPGTELAAMPVAAHEPASDGRDHFVVVRCAVEWIDWLYLRHGGHRRMRLRLGDIPQGTWIAP